MRHLKIGIVPWVPVAAVSSRLPLSVAGSPAHRQKEMLAAPPSSEDTSTRGHRAHGSEQLWTCGFRLPASHPQG